jgi:hypothetical protein
VCALALVVQIVDLAGMYRYVSDLRSFGFRDPLHSPFWTAVLPQYDGLVLIPPNLCAHEGYLDFVPFALHAGTAGIAINTGMTARFDVRKARLYCDELRREIRDGLRPDRSLYVVRPDLLPAMTNREGNDPMCTVIDGFGVCFSKESFARWRETFDLPRSRLPETAELLRFYAALDETYRTALGRPVREVAGAREKRLDALTQYLALRMEGCGHALAEERALGLLHGRREPGLCGTVALHHTLPPADQTFAFSARATEVLQQNAGAVSQTHVDPEGEAVWLQAYVAERTKGLWEDAARQTVIAAVRRAAQ